MTHPHRTIGAWQVVFNRDCNLCCSYCSTGQGRFGGPPRRMSPAVWAQFVDFALVHAPKENTLRLELGGGEPFLDFALLLDCLDHFSARAREQGIDVSVAAVTNGTLLDREGLEALADRGINLMFSIDGPKEIHDRHRRTTGGEGSFNRAMNAWREYRELSRVHPNRPACTVQSVISDQGGLMEVDGFWRDRGEALYMAIVREPSRYGPNEPENRWHERRRRYLEDLEHLAYTRARELSVPTFLSEFRGPSIILDLWTRMLTESRQYGFCLAGEDILAVDVQGDLYPCEGFIGRASWIVGDLDKGIDGEKISRFQVAKTRITSACRACDAEGLCDGGCLAASRDGGLSLNTRHGCDFSRQLVEIGRQSYLIMGKEQPHG